MQHPFVLNKIRDNLRDCTNGLDIVAPSRVIRTEQRPYLLQISKSFGDLIKAVTAGSYPDLFFLEVRLRKGVIESG